MKKEIIIKLFLIATILTSCNSNQQNENVGMDIKSETYFVNDTLEHVKNKECKVILLYGQSNATGYSQNWYFMANDPDLYDIYKVGFSNVKINYVIEGNSILTDNSFVELKLENTNVGWTFGPEMGIAEIYSNTYPDEDIFIIKYAYGGSCLANDWLDSNGKKDTLYKNAIDFTKKNLDYLKKIGYKPHIEGICWMQGEADAFDLVYESYYDNTKLFVNYLRSDLWFYQFNIKFIDAYIEDIDVWPRYKEINEQKLKFALESDNNFVIDTIALGLRTDEEPWEGVDIYHYDSLSMVTLGREYAKIMIENQ